MSDASYIYAEINEAKNQIEQCKTKIEEYKKKREKLKKAKSILKESKSDISDEKRSARQTLREFIDWKGSNYDKHGRKVQGELWIPGGYTVGGVPEAVVNHVPNNLDAISIGSIKLERK